MKKMFKVFVIVSMMMTLCTSCAALFFGATADSKTNQSTKK